MLSRDKTVNLGIKNSNLNNYLLVLIMVDYILTYFGINYLGAIVEGNPLLVDFFNLPFIYSFFLRLLHASIIVLICEYLLSLEYKYYDLFMKFAIGVNVLVMLVHIRWIYIFIYRLTANVFA